MATHEVILNFLILIVAGFLILKTTDWFVDGAVAIATAFRLSKVFIGVTVVSLVTTLPELVVSGTSSFLGDPGMAVGNAVGSCICNIGFVFPVAAVIRNIAVRRDDFEKIAFLFVSLLFTLIFVAGGSLGRPEAAALIVFLVFFLAYNYRAARRERARVPEVELPGDGNRRMLRGFALLLVGGLATVLIARYGLVVPGIAIAGYFNVPSILVGLTLISIGTSLPELFTAVVASRRQHGEIALGNVLGASIFNLLWVLGVAGLIRPLEVDRQTLFFNLPAAVAITLAMFFLGRRQRNFTKAEGVALLSVYLLYIIALFAFIY